MQPKSGVREIKTDLSANDIKLVSAYLSSNVQYLRNELEDTNGLTSFSQIANTIIYMALPRYKQNCNVNVDISINSMLDEIALIKIMHQQTMQLASHIEKKDPQFAAWVKNLIIDFIKKAAIKLIERRSSAGFNDVERLG